MSGREFLADLLMVAHAAFATFVLGGLLLILLGTILRWRWIRDGRFRLVHLTLTLMLVGRVWLGFPCPFSVGENALRRDIVAQCPLGEPFHKISHFLAFRGRNPQRFGFWTSAIGVVAVGLFMLNRPTLWFGSVRKLLAKSGAKDTALQTLRAVPGSHNNASCIPLGSRNELTPRPNNRSGRDTSFSRARRKQARR